MSVLLSCHHWTGFDVEQLYIIFGTQDTTHWYL